MINSAPAGEQNKTKSSLISNKLNIDLLSNYW